MHAAAQLNSSSSDIHGQLPNTAGSNQVSRVASVCPAAPQVNPGVVIAHGGGVADCSAGAELPCLVPADKETILSLAFAGVAGVLSTCRGVAGGVRVAPDKHPSIHPLEVSESRCLA